MEQLSKEEISKVVEENFRGLRDCIEDKALAEWYIEVIKTMLEHYFESNVPHESIEILKDIMTEFIEAHNMLSKTLLSSEDYNPISFKLAHAKIKLSNFTILYKNKKS